MHFKDMKIAKDDVHIWSASLDDYILHRKLLLPVISPDEEARANRFYFEMDRKRYLIGRGILRTLLGRYLGIEAGLVRLCCEKHGKPSLAGKEKNEVQFNLSHSDGFALYAFTRHRKVGVDVEHIREIPEMDQIVERFFTSKEKDYFHYLPAGRKIDFFFRLWTCKEAYAKGTGIGLHQPLENIEVFPDSRKAARSYRRKIFPENQATEWQIHDLSPAPGFAGAFAVQGVCNVQLYQFHIDLKPHNDPFC